MAIKLQVRAIDGAVFWIETTTTSSIGSIKQTIMSARGIDVVMQKLICAGKLLADESTPELYGITERDFLVLVTAKPRPPSLVSTGAPLPSSYQSHLLSGGMHGDDDGDGEDAEDVPHDLGDDADADDDGEDEGDGDDDEEEVGSHFGGGDASDEAARFVEMGFDAHDAEQALRLSCNDPRRALTLLRSGRISAGDEAVRALQDRLRCLPAFHSLQQVVRVDPQIMLVLNTEAMRFEDPKSEQMLGEPSTDSVSAKVSQEREAVEKAFWDACALELTSTPPVYERTLQLVQEVRDTLCSLMPSHWDEQLLLASDYAEQMRGGIVAARAYGSGLTNALVIPYMRAVSGQVRMLCSDARAADMERWLASTLSRLEPYCSAEAGEQQSGIEATSAYCDDESDKHSDTTALDIGNARSKPDKTDSTTGINAMTTVHDCGESSVSPEIAHEDLPALLLRFFRVGFEVLEAIKLDMANSHLVQLLDSDHTLRHAIASRPNDFVVLLNAADSDPSVPLDNSESTDLTLGMHEHRSLVYHGMHDNRPHSFQALQDLQDLQQQRTPLQGTLHLSTSPPAGSGHGATSVLGDATVAEGHLPNDTLDRNSTDAHTVSLLNGGGSSSGHSTDGLRTRLRRRVDAYGDDDDSGGEDDVHNLVRDGRHHGVSRRNAHVDEDEDEEYDDAHEHPLTSYGIDGVHHRSLDDATAPLAGELPGAPEMHSELMEAVMQQWLHTPAGQSAAQEAARLELSTDEVGQFFHARMLQSLGRLRLGETAEAPMDQLRVAVGALSAADEEAVQRLTALGFAREQVAEAYLACDRNEMLAANFLMDHQ